MPSDETCTWIMGGGIVALALEQPLASGMFLALLAVGAWVNTPRRWTA